MGRREFFPRLGIAIAIVIVGLLGWRDNALGIRTTGPWASVALAFDAPPPAPGYEWTFEGRPLSRQAVASFAGPDHCGWQSATMLFIGSGDLRRQYIRDPKGVMRRSLQERLGMHVEMPRDARPTGYRLGAIELWLSPSDELEAAYVVGPGGSERWPRSDPPTMCA